MQEPSDCLTPPSSYQNTFSQLLATCCENKTVSIKQTTEDPAMDAAHTHVLAGYQKEITRLTHKKADLLKQNDALSQKIQEIKTQIQGFKPIASQPSLNGAPNATNVLTTEQSALIISSFKEARAELMQKKEQNKLLVQANQQKEAQKNTDLDQIKNNKELISQLSAQHLSTKQKKEAQKKQNVLTKASLKLLKAGVAKRALVKQQKIQEIKQKLESFQEEIERLTKQIDLIDAQNNVFAKKQALLVQTKENLALQAQQNLRSVLLQRQTWTEKLEGFHEVSRALLFHLASQLQSHYSTTTSNSAHEPILSLTLSNSSATSDTTRKANMTP